MKKKIIPKILISAFTVVMLTSCSAPSQTSQEQTEIQTTQTSQETTQTQPAQTSAIPDTTAQSNQTGTTTPEPKPASFQVSGLVITPSEAEIGKTITIEVNVTNTGELSGAYDVNLKIDGQVLATEKVTLAGGASQKVTFTRLESTAKSYLVDIETQHGIFVIKTPIPPPPSTPTQPESAYFLYKPGWTQWGIAGFGKDFPATGGTGISFVRAGEGTSPKGYPTIKFELVAYGLPKDKVFYLWNMGLDQSTPTQLPYEMKIAEDGYIMAGNSRLSLSLGDFAKGEALSVALITTDKSLIAYGKIMLNPIEVKTGTYRMWAELISPAGTAFVVYGEGFEADETLETTSASESEVLKSTAKVDITGKFLTVLLPGVVGKQSGMATYTVVGEKCSLSLSYEWGSPALRSGP